MSLCVCAWCMCVCVCVCVCMCVCACVCVCVCMCVCMCVCVCVCVWVGEYMSCCQFSVWRIFTTQQHTATHCNTLQHTLQHTVTHTATHCNTLQHTPQHTAHTSRIHQKRWTATHCNTLQHTEKHCNTIIIPAGSAKNDEPQNTAKNCNILQHTSYQQDPQKTMNRNTLQHTAKHCNTFHTSRIRKKWQMPPCILESHVACSASCSSQTLWCVCERETDCVIVQVWICHGKDMDGLCHTNKWVTSLIWMSHVAHTRK